MLSYSLLRLALPPRCAVVGSTQARAIGFDCITSKGNTGRLASLFMGALAAMLMTPSLALAIPSYGVSILAPSPGFSTCPGASISISNSLVPLGREEACSVALPGTAAASAAATFGSVGAVARAATNSGSSTPFGIQGGASFADTLTFSKTDPNAPDQFLVSLNLTFAGTVNAAAGAPGSLGSAAVEIRVSFLSARALDFSYNSSDGLTVSNSGNYGGTGTIAPGASGFSTLLTTPTQLASVGDQSVSLSLTAGAISIGNGASATAEFSNTLEFPTGVDVFNLPAGYTVNAGDYLVNNRFVTPVPEPATLLLLGSGLAALAGFRKKWLRR